MHVAYLLNEQNISMFVLTLPSLYTEDREIHSAIGRMWPKRACNQLMVVAQAAMFSLDIV